MTANSKISVLYRAPWLDAPPKPKAKEGHPLRNLVEVEHTVNINPFPKGMLLVDAIEFLTDRLNEIPIARRHEAVFEVGADLCSYKVCYSRKENDKEYECRLKSANRADLK